MAIARYLTLIFCFWISSCASKTDQVVPPDYAMEAAFENIRSNISRLAIVGQKNEWFEASDDRFRIESSDDLDRALRYFGDEDSPEKNQARKAALLDHLATSASSYLFGFECDYSIITFFDRDGNQTYCYPEHYLNKSKKENKPEMATPRKPSD